MRRLRLFVLLAMLLPNAAPVQAATIPARDAFLQSATGIDSAAAAAFANALTDADWYEADTSMLLDAFQASLDAREHFAWGQTYPDSMFYQYVIPLRVDDEPLHDFRRMFLEDMAPRLDSLTTLARAALEVNLYLGERIGFKPTDWRDQGPLTTLSCGYGRCGEMMIAAIDAMRSVGIPARGVYVPFWSASDNNHAWIEVYTEDGWKYMGACEPAERLNRAWFDNAVLRAGILLTKDRSDSPENPDAVKVGGGYALNVTRNYVPPARLIVHMPADWSSDDHAWFSLFNFGTLRPLVELAPRDGVASMEIGNGDFVLMGIYQGSLFFQPFTAQIQRTTEVTLDPGMAAPQNFTLTYPWPPRVIEKEPALLPEWRIKLGHALRRERDAKRAWDSDWLDRLVQQDGEQDSVLFATLKRAPGNEAAIVDAVLSVPEEQRANAVFIVSHLSDKDLRDVPAAILQRWVTRSAGDYADNDELKPFVLDPQVAYEYPGTGRPADYTSAMNTFESFAGIRTAVAQYAPQMDPTLRQRPLPPVTLDRMLADGLSISTMNGAIWWTDRMRRSGIPARCAPFSDWMEFYMDGEWLPLVPDDPAKLGDRDAHADVAAHYGDPATVTVRWAEATTPPEWESEFLLLPIRENGRPDFRADSPEDLRKEDANTVVTLVPGTYLLTAGRRNGRGDVSVLVRSLELKAGDATTLELDLVPPVEPPASGNIDLNMADLEWKPASRAGRHLLIVLGDNEPSKRTHDQAVAFDDSGLAVDFVEGLDALGKADRETLGLSDRDDSGAPYVYCFDEAGHLLFTQAGYDLNLPNRLRNSRR